MRHSARGTSWTIIACLWWLATAPAAPAQPLVEARLTSILDSLRTAVGAKGMSAAVILPNGTAWTGASGDAWEGTPVGSATVFDVGSITKSYTAALILRLVGAGRLSLDDSLTRWHPGVPGAAGVTIRHLLSHTSGLADYASHPEFMGAIRAGIAGPWAPRDNLRFIGQPQFTPGSRWGYSNTNYVLLGLIAEEITRRSYATLLRELLDSLSLASTFVAGADSVAAPRAHAYLDFTGDGVPDDLSALVPDPAFTRGAGGAGAVLATASDLAAFARAYYSGALLPAALATEFAKRVDRADGWQYGFGLIEAPGDSGPLLGHFGNTAGQSAGVWHDATRNITVVLLSNVHGVRLDDALRRLLEEAGRD